jgi:hypothetical protein
LFHEFAWINNWPGCSLSFVVWSYTSLFTRKFLMSKMRCLLPVVWHSWYRYVNRCCDYRYRGTGYLRTVYF